MPKQKLFLLLVSSFVVGAITAGVATISIVSVTSAVSSTLKSTVAAIPDPYGKAQLKFTPLELVDKATEYIISKVGRTYFHTFYTLDITATENSNYMGTSYKGEGGPQMIRYTVQFKNLALKDISGQEEKAGVYFNGHGDIIGDFGNYDWRYYPSSSEFKISKEEATRLAQEAGFNVTAKEFSISTTPLSGNGFDSKGWGWSISQGISNSSDPPACGTWKTMEINISTGKKSEVAINHFCAD
ncbi:MAG: hypothetical protein HYV42_00125 [Candidatus Magasanikbacteria bacterium]|nr:hypothetical protein [Candidatus Magasanikbacteria bacterium]